MRPLGEGSKERLLWVIRNVYFFDRWWLSEWVAETSKGELLKRGNHKLGFRELSFEGTVSFWS